MALRGPLKAHFYHFWAPAAQMAFRKVIGARGRVCIAPVWPKTLSIAPVQLKSAHGMGPQGSSLYRTCATEVTFYRPCAAQIAVRRLLEARFEHFWALLPKWLSGGL